VCYARVVLKKLRLLAVFVFVMVAFGAYGVRMIQDGDNPAEGLAIGALLLVIVGFYVRWKWRLGNSWNRQRGQGSRRRAEVASP
jgi:hypothetical protein